MADSFLGYQNPTSVDKRLDTESLTVNSVTVERERIRIAGAGATDLAPVDPTNGLAVDIKGAGLTALQLIDDPVGTVGSAAPTKGFLVGGSDGTNIRAIKVDSTGVVSTTNPTTEASLALIDDPVAVNGSAVPTKGFLMSGTDGTNARGIKTNTAGVLAVQDNGASLTVDGQIDIVPSGSNLYSNLMGDFTATANNGAKTISFTSYANSVLSGSISVKNFANAIIKRISSGGVVDSLPLTNIAFSANTLTLSDMAANFASGDTVAVYIIGPDKGYDETNDQMKISTTTAVVNSITGGGNIYSNIHNDFTATANTGARTITLSSFANSVLSGTITAKSFANALIKRVASSGVVDTLPLTNVAYSGAVLTLADMSAVFNAGDTVAVFIPGPDKGFDESNDLIKVGLAQAIEGVKSGAELDHIGTHPKKRADAFQDLSIDGTAATSAQDLKAATASKKHYVTNLTISVDAAQTLTIRDSNSNTMEKIVLPAAGCYQFFYGDCPLETDTNTKVQVVSSASSGVLVIKGRGYTI